ncbi:MAG: DivIVA domain-containing protein [Mycoplasma sp.]|nr:DivIVA domain-containing protein [Mycoplasma sp.]
MKELISKIIDKKFESVINGYSPSSVDIFLDSIIKELLIFEDKYKQLMDEKQEILDEKNALMKRNAILEMELKSTKQEDNFQKENNEIKDKKNE